MHAIFFISMCTVTLVRMFALQNINKEFFQTSLLIISQLLQAQIHFEKIKIFSMFNTFKFKNMKIFIDLNLIISYEAYFLQWSNTFTKNN